MCDERMCGEKMYRRRLVILANIDSNGSRQLGLNSDKAQSIEVLGGNWVVYLHAEWDEDMPMHGPRTSRALGPGKYTQADLASGDLDRGISPVKFVGARRD